jgi:gamma-glutamyltranspeptidase/glutathione hydrolase
MTWRQALDRWGRFPLAADLRPAEHAARAGFTVDDAVSEEIRENEGRFAQFSSTKSLFLPGGAVPSAGTLLRNPDLARTYRQIGREGVGALYGGPIGADVVQTVHQLPLAPGATLTPRPGPMALSDLAGYSAPFVPPTHVNYRGYDVYSMAPSSSGGSTVGESLNILSNFDLSHETRVQALHHYLESTRLAFADRNRYVGDPRFENVPLAQLLSVPFGRQRACLINPGQALTSPVAPGDPFAGDQGCTPQQPTNAGQADQGTHTNHFVVADSRGDVVSYTNTIEQLGGSGMVVPGRGFLLNNELTDFDFVPLQKGVPDPNLPAAANGRARACRRRSCCDMTARSWRSARRVARRSSPRFSGSW